MWKPSGDSIGKLTECRLAGATYRTDIDVGTLAGADIINWRTTTPLAVGRYFPAVASDGRFLWVAAGTSASGNLADVQVAPILPDGSLGSWTTTTPLPTARGGLSMVAANGSLIAVGGYAGSPATAADVSTALINPVTGAVGAWTATTALTGARGEAAE